MSEPYWVPLGGAPAVPGFTLIEDKLITGAYSPIDFTGIPQTFRSLWLVAALRTHVAAEYEPLSVRFNGDNVVGSYAGQQFYAVAGTLAGTNPNGGQVGNVNGGTATANTFAAFDLLVPDYRNATHHKIAMSRLGLMSATQGFYQASIRYGGTGPITQITLVPNAGAATFAVDSRATLYGLI